MGMIRPWHCGNGHEFFVREFDDNDVECCPICQAPSQIYLAKLAQREWEKQPLFKWAKRKTNDT